MGHDSLAERAKAIVDHLASAPRGAGSDEEARARGFCADYLTRLGFTVGEEEFSYSALPGKWAVPAFGLLSLAWFVLLGGALGRPDPGRAVVMASPFLLLLPLLYALAIGIQQRSGPLRRSGTNLVAVRGGEPRIWLVAHLDSKSQPIPMLIRIAGIVMAASALVLTVLMGFAPRSTGSTAMWVAADVVGIAGSLTMLLSTVGNRSPGALDNASGVTAALLTASQVEGKKAVGVLLTSAEELGLAGARAWARGQRSRSAGSSERCAVNFDSLDDVGQLTCMAGRDNRLSDRVRAAAKVVGREVVFRGVLPGIMVDANALDSSDLYAVTLSKGNLSTLTRIHSSRDTADRLTGAGIAEAVELATQVIRQEG